MLACVDPIGLSPLSMQTGRVAPGMVHRNTAIDVTCVALTHVQRCNVHAGHAGLAMTTQTTTHMSSTTMRLLAFHWKHLWLTPSTWTGRWASPWAPTSPSPRCRCAPLLAILGVLLEWWPSQGFQDGSIFLVRPETYLPSESILVQKWFEHAQPSAAGAIRTTWEQLRQLCWVLHTKSACMCLCLYAYGQLQVLHACTIACHSHVTQTAGLH